MPDDGQALLLQVSADLSKLEKQMAKIMPIVNAATGGAEARVKRFANSINGDMGRVDIGGALSRVFDSTRLKVMDTGIARVGLFGSAFQSLGPLALGAAAGVAAAAVAFDQAKKAMDFADNLSDAATRLHVTTDALQEYRAALVAAGGDEAGVDAALENFSSLLGKAQAGVPKALKAFKELFGNAFTAADAKKLGDVESALDTITTKIGGLRSNTQKDAIVDQLGLTGMKTLIEGGADAMRNLREEARKAGLIMSSELVERAGRLHDQFEVATKVISVQLMSAFVDLGPVLVGIAEKMADLAKIAASIANDFRSLEDRGRDNLFSERAELIAANETLDRVTKGRLFRPEEAAIYNGNLTRITRLDEQIAKTAPSARPGAPTGGVDLHAPAAKSSGATGPTTQQQRDKAGQALLGAQRDELRAQESLTHNIQALAALRSKEIDAELAQRNASIQKDLDDPKLTDAAARKTLTAAKAQNIANAELQKQAVAADLAEQQRQDFLTEQARQVGLVTDITDLQAEQARTVAARVKLERDALQTRQGQERLDLEEGLRKDLLQGRITEDDATFERDRLGERQGLQTDAFNRDHLTGFAAVLAKAPKSIAELNEKFTELETQGLANLNSGLADAIVNAKSLGEVGAGVFRQLQVQILELLIQSAEGKIATFLGFADGGFTGPGGRNQPAGIVHKGEFVFDQAAVKRLGVKELEALRKGGVPGYAAGGLVGIAMPSLSSFGAPAPVFVSNNFHLTSPVMTEDLLAQMNQIGAQAADAGARGGSAMAMQRLQSRARNRLGR